MQSELSTVFLSLFSLHIRGVINRLNAWPPSANTPQGHTRSYSWCMFVSDWLWIGVLWCLWSFFSCLLLLPFFFFLNNADVSRCVAICRPFILHCHPIRCQHCLSMGDGQVGVFTRCLWILTKDWYYSKTHTRTFIFVVSLFQIRTYVHVKLQCNDITTFKNLLLVEPWHLLTTLLLRQQSYIL